jgi:hypothetical protein
MASMKSILPGLMAALLSGGAGAQDIADAGYMPMYMLYTGDPSPARLAGLRQFLERNQMPQAVTSETLDIVAYKLRQFKTGFAYPVYSSETATEGNACVVADNHHNTADETAALLAGSVVAKYVLGGRMPALKREDVLENIMHHELFHCHDALSMSLVEVGTRIARDGAAYFAYQAESGADAYASLHYLRKGGDKRLLRQIRDFRTLNLLNGDAAHYTSRAIDHIVWNYDARRLQGMSTRELIALARAIRDETALTPSEFAQVTQASSQFRQALVRAAGEATRRDADELVNLVYDVPLDAEFASQLILQVRGALHGLGGDIRSGNAFHTVFNRYFLPVQFRIAHADISR